MQSRFLFSCELILKLLINLYFRKLPRLYKIQFSLHQRGKTRDQSMILAEPRSSKVLAKLLIKIFKIGYLFFSLWNKRGQFF